MILGMKFINLGYKFDFFLFLNKNNFIYLFNFIFCDFYENVVFFGYG